MRTEKINWNNWNWNAYTSLKGSLSISCAKQTRTIRSKTSVKMPFWRCKATVVDPKNGTFFSLKSQNSCKSPSFPFFPYPWKNTQMKQKSCFPTSYGRKQAECLQISRQKAASEKANCLKSILCVPIGRSPVCFVQVTFKSITFSKYQLSQIFSLVADL